VAAFPQKEFTNRRAVRNRKKPDNTAASCRRRGLWQQGHRWCIWVQAGIQGTSVLPLRRWYSCQNHRGVCRGRAF